MDTFLSKREPTIYSQTGLYGVVPSLFHHNMLPHGVYHPGTEMLSQVSKLNILMNPERTIPSPTCFGSPQTDEEKTNLYNYLVKTPCSVMQAVEKVGEKNCFLLQTN